MRTEEDELLYNRPQSMHKSSSLFKYCDVLLQMVNIRRVTCYYYYYYYSCCCCCCVDGADVIGVGSQSSEADETSNDACDAVLQTSELAISH